MITGEAVPVRKSAGDSVIGGTINVSGALWLRVRALGADSAVHRIMKLVCEAQMRRPKVNPHPHPHSHPHPHPHPHPHSHQAAPRDLVGLALAEHAAEVEEGLALGLMAAPMHSRSEYTSHPARRPHQRPRCCTAQNPQTRTPRASLDSTQARTRTTLVTPSAVC